MDYTWKQNRLSKDKEALKNSVLNVIRKKPAEKEEKAAVTGGQTPIIQASYVQQTPEQGYTAMKTDNYGVANNNQVGVGQKGTMAALASKQTQQQQMVNKRGSEFKKSAQQMLNK